jgi:hypothetical protein
MNMSSIVAGVFLMAAALGAQAAEWKPVEGLYAITARNYLDPAEDEPKDSHLRLQLSGKTARALYAAMKSAAKPDACTGALARSAGAMQCLFFQREKKYECHFSIDIARQKLEYGVAC